MPAERLPIRQAAVGLARRAVVVWLAALLIGVATLSASYAAGGTASSTKSAKASAETASPAEIDALLSLLADAKVQAWLKQQHATEAADPAPAKPKDDSPAEMMSSRLDAVRAALR